MHIVWENGMKTYTFWIGLRRFWKEGGGEVSSNTSYHRGQIAHQDKWSSHKSFPLSNS